MEQDLLKAFLVDIAKMVKENPNDMDLGKEIRNYFLGLPSAILEFKTKIDENKKG